MLTSALASKKNYFCLDLVFSWSLVLVLALNILSLNPHQVSTQHTCNVEKARNCSKLVADRFEAKFHYAIWFEAGCRQSWSQTGSKLVADLLATKFHNAVQLACRSQTSLRPNSIKPWFHVKIKLFERILF